MRRPPTRRAGRAGHPTREPATPHAHHPRRAPDQPRAVYWRRAGSGAGVPNNLANVRVSNEWTKSQAIDYKLTREKNGLFLHLVPNTLGAHPVVVRAQAERSPPSTRPAASITSLPPLRLDFVVRASRLRFLNPDRKDITYDDAGRTAGTELILDDGHNFDLRRTYRIEGQQEAGGALVAELFTRSYLSNDRVLCQLRVYNTHRQSEGYLYIKDGDLARVHHQFRHHAAAAHCHAQRAAPRRRLDDYPHD
ncbi:MAG: hypothetical protein WKG07_32145 [Hymenobacter sp.]